jgi:cytoskeletal protein CcmA (bactofilin family)
MFNNQKPQPSKAKPQPKNTAVTILTSGCHFNGKLYCRGSSRIAGRIEGQIVSEGLLIIEEEPMIVAEVTADEAIIQGRVQGKLSAKGRVELCPSSRFDGDIQTPLLTISEGAQFNGRASMSSAPMKDEKNPGILEAVNGKGNGPRADMGKANQHDVGKVKDVVVMKVPEVNPSS